MKNIPIDKEKIVHLIEDILSSRNELERLVSVSREDFSKNKQYYAESEHYFRRVLEGIITAGTHIVSRLPKETKDYTAVIKVLGEVGIINPEFAQKNKGLAGYRNRLVHLYWEVKPEELYEIIKEHLKDIEIFALSFKDLLKNPKKFGLTVFE